MQFHLGYVTETIWNHNFYPPLVCHLTSDLKVFTVYTRRSIEFNIKTSFITQRSIENQWITKTKQNKNKNKQTHKQKQKQKNKTKQKIVVKEQQRSHYMQKWHHSENYSTKYTKNETNTKLWEEYDLQAEAIILINRIWSSVRLQYMVHLNDTIYSRWLSVWVDLIQSQIIIIRCYIMAFSRWSG